jgi:hypothetical protein
VAELPVQYTEQPELEAPGDPAADSNDAV